jgi:hypothetical protein
MSRRTDTVGVIFIFAGALAVLDVVDAPFYIALLVAAVGYSGARAGVEWLRDELRHDGRIDDPTLDDFP